MNLKLALENIETEEQISSFMHSFLDCYQGLIGHLTYCKENNTEPMQDACETATIFFELYHALKDLNDEGEKKPRYRSPFLNYFKDLSNGDKSKHTINNILENHLKIIEFILQEYNLYFIGKDMDAYSKELNLLRSRHNF